jgi:hypothetical protein
MAKAPSGVVVEQIERQRGQRPNPNDTDSAVLGTSAIDETAAEAINASEKVRLTVATDVKVVNEKDGEHEPRIIPQFEQIMQDAENVLQLPARPRHGCVEQRRGISIRDHAGNVIGITEQWRCQCNQYFKGESAKATEQLYLRHLRQEDPDVPKR